MIKNLMIVCFGGWLAACGDRSSSKGSKANVPGKHSIFPVTKFFAGQLYEIDSLNLRAVQYTTTETKTDTALLSKNEFTLLANEFMQPDISDSSLKNYYTETSFADQSIPSVTLTYATVKEELEIQRLDVVIQPDPDESDKVKSVYLEKITHREDTLIIKKLLWRTSRYFQITTSKQVGQKPATNSQLKVSWNTPY
ncbi:MAG: hypothetical protein WKF89_09905 [Chitinophagaceae bacterium]